MTPGRRELERPTRPLLAAHVCQVGRVRLDPLRRRVDGRRPELAAQVRDRLGEVPDRDGLDAAELGLGRGLGRAEDSIEPGQPGALGDREGAAHRPDATVERELADRGVLREPFGRHLAGGCEQREPDREVEAGALLPQARRREVDRDPPQRPLELGGGDAAADTMLRLRAGTVGEADDGEGRHAALQVRLDLDTSRLEPDKSVGDGAREHASTLGAGVQRECNASASNA